MGMSDYSLADVAAATGKDDGCGFGGGYAWVLIILFALIFGFGGGGIGSLGGGGALQGASAATTADVQRAVDLSSIQGGQADLGAQIQRTAYETMGTVKDASYNNLSELRDVQTALNAGFANMQNCCCSLDKSIMENRYLAEKNSAGIINAVQAEGSATRALIQQNKIETLQSRVSELEMQTALCGVPKVSPYGFATVPNFPGCGCGYASI